MVVLGEDLVRAVRVAGHLVHALAELRPRVGQEVRLDAGVRGRPGRAAVGGLVHAAGGHRDQDPVMVGRVRQDAVDRLAAEAGGPLRTVRVVPQAADELVRHAAVDGPEQRRGLGPRVHHVGPAGRPGRELPDPGQGGVGVRRVRHRGVIRFVPGLAQVVAGRDTGPEMRAFHAGEQARGPPPGVDRRRVDPGHGEVRAVDRPVPPVVAAGQEQPLTGTDCEQHCHAGQYARGARRAGPFGGLRRQDATIG